MVGSWEVVIATLHTDLVHNLLVPLMSYVSIKPSSSYWTEIGISEYRMTLRFFNVNSVSLLENGTCIKQRAQSGASYIHMSYRRSYIYGALNRMKGFGLEPAQMQLLAGRHLIMELKAEGWSGLKKIILGARQHILDGGVREILAEEAGEQNYY